MGRTPRSQTKNNSARDLNESSRIFNKSFGDLNKSNHSIIQSELTQWVDIENRFGKPHVDQTIRLVGIDKYLDSINQEIRYFLQPRVKKPQYLLVSGPQDSGKTSAILSAIQTYVDSKIVSLFNLNCSWFKRKSFGDPEQSLRILIDGLPKKLPSIIFIQNIDVAKLDIMLDFLGDIQHHQSKVLLIAETENPESLDRRLLKGKYFSYQMKFTLPKPENRLEFLNHFLSDMENDLLSDEINQIVDKTNCYTYDDLIRVCQGADKIAYRTNDKLNFAAFNIVLSEYKLKNVISAASPCKPLSWDQIGGVERAKAELRESLIYPLKYRKQYDDVGECKIKGALLYGPPGCSKTLLARALATESGFNFIYIKGPELLSKYVGDSEAQIRKIYRNAMDLAPCMIFIDEIDSLAPKRTDNHDSVGSRLTTTLLLELDSAVDSGEVFTIGATNRPNSLDAALLRDGRLELQIYIPLPTRSDRSAIFKIHMAGIQTKLCEPIDEIAEKLAARTKGYSGAEIAGICRRAMKTAMRENRHCKYVEWSHLTAAVDERRPRTDSNALKEFRKFQRGQSTNPSLSSKKNHDEESCSDAERSDLADKIRDINIK